MKINWRWDVVFHSRLYGYLFRYQGNDTVIYMDAIVEGFKDEKNKSEAVRVGRSGRGEL